METITKTRSLKSNIFILTAATAMMVSCASPEKRAQDETDTSQNTQVNDTAASDSTATNVVNATGSMSGSNNSGINSTDTKPQKITPPKGKN